MSAENNTLVVLNLAEKKQTGHHHSQPVLQEQSMHTLGFRFFVLLSVSLLYVAILNGEPTSRWHRLFNGQDLSGWSTTGNWQVAKNGILSIQPRPGEHGWERYGDYLWTKKQYANFSLRLDYKIPPKGNSGIFLGVKNRDNPVYEGVEIQILDSHGKKEPLTAHDCGGVIGFESPKRNMARPAGEWNQLQITCKGDHLLVDLNGTTIIDTRLGNRIKRPQPLAGYLGLQDHGLSLEFRNIEIKSL